MRMTDPGRQKVSVGDLVFKGNAVVIVVRINLSNIKDWLGQCAVGFLKDRP